jgi:hypothetical protein
MDLNAEHRDAAEAVICHACRMPASQFYDDPRGALLCWSTVPCPWSIVRCTSRKCVAFPRRSTRRAPGAFTQRSGWQPSRLPPAAQAIRRGRPDTCGGQEPGADRGGISSRSPLGTSPRGPGRVLWPQGCLQRMPVWGPGVVEVTGVGLALPQTHGTAEEVEPATVDQRRRTRAFRNRLARLGAGHLRPVGDLGDFIRRCQAWYRGGWSRCAALPRQVHLWGILRPFRTRSCYG